ncbi:hypothetical protein [Nocardioides bruguierae]|uniref:Uncharacterized protein n=1 Tax=Nocardioides bruguierae TaxID=2945102 RepID=A0A9X2D5A3_9ACTN|nr:hypothetical protein [Nocardioides bruguierae]MCM0619443.1 hypothetical protein [Nocardioides bruguierae]
MGLKLRIKLDTPTGDLDPSVALADLRAVLSMLKDMDASVSRRDDPAHTQWRFAAINIGSLDAIFEPEAADAEGAAQASLRLVRGFAAAESMSAIPETWSVLAARRAKTIADHIPPTSRSGVHLELIDTNEVVASASISRRAGINLGRAMQPNHESIGSVLGHLGSISVRGKRRAAGVWPERGGGRVEVRFTADQLDEVRAAVGHKRVLVSGRLRRNDHGQLIRVSMRQIQVLSTTGTQTLLRGAGPDITGELGTVEYLRSIRESS